MRWLLSALLALCCIAVADEAKADRIHQLSKRLHSSRSDKVRISAALSLAKESDTRAVLALTRSLQRDSSPAIRRISAASLGQALRKELDGKTRKAALKALRKAAHKDRDPDVRSSAKVALTKSRIRQQEVPDAETAPVKGVLVTVGAPKAQIEGVPRHTLSIMQSSIRSVVRDKRVEGVDNAPGTGMPASASLKRSGLAGYSIVPAVSALRTHTRGGKAYVQCEVTLRVGPWAEAGESLSATNNATVSGAGSVASGSSASAIREAQKSCISAVVSQVTASQVLPYLAAKIR